MRVIIALGTLFILFGLFKVFEQLAHQDSVRTKCLNLGYPRYAVEGKNNYCIATVDGSDVVVSTEIAPPLAWVEVK